MIGSPDPMPPVPARGPAVRRWTLLLTSLVLVLQLSWPAASWAISLPGLGPRDSGSGGARPLAPSSPAGRLQESPPPVAVQQLQEALADVQPLITIESPATRRCCQTTRGS